MEIAELVVLIERLIRGFGQRVRMQVSAKSLPQGEGSITNSAGSDATAVTVVRTLASNVFSIDVGRGVSAKHACEQIVHWYRRGVTPRKTGLETGVKRIAPFGRNISPHRV